MNEYIKKLKLFMTKENRIRLIMIAGILGVVFILMSDFSSFDHKEQNISKTDLEQKLKITLESMEGVGSAEVMVQLQSDDEICGVIIICEGGSSAVSKEKISKAVTTVFGISANKVYIEKLDK